MRWRIYYGDGAVLEGDSEGGAPWDVPGVDVQAIVQEDPEVGRYVLHGADFYWWHPDGQWHQGDTFGLWDFLQRPGPRKVAFGRSLSNADYRAILDRALNDPGFPPKTARLPGERLP